MLVTKEKSNKFILLPCLAHSVETINSFFLHDFQYAVVLNHK